MEKHQRKDARKEKSTPKRKKHQQRQSARATIKADEKRQRKDARRKHQKRKNAREKRAGAQTPTKENTKKSRQMETPEKKEARNQKTQERKHQQWKSAREKHQKKNAISSSPSTIIHTMTSSQTTFLTYRLLLLEPSAAGLARLLCEYFKKEKAATETERNAIAEVACLKHDFVQQLHCGEQFGLQVGLCFDLLKQFVLLLQPACVCAWVGCSCP